MDKYEFILYWSNEDQAFIAEVPELPGCTVHGSTLESAPSNANEAIQLWIDTAREFGHPVPQPKGKRLMLAWQMDATGCWRKVQVCNVLAIPLSGPGSESPPLCHHNCLRPT
jgi:predicted RNase H-like HicB family nuclease